VRIEEVNRLAKTLLAPERLRLSVVGPHRNTALYEKLLAAA
jgi:hypothetical protein